MRETRPFYRVSNVTKYQAAIEQIEAAIAAFHDGHFAASITLAGAAEGMASRSPGRGLWNSIVIHTGRPLPDKKAWISRLNASRDWLKHDQAAPTRNLVSFEAGLFILRAMDKWEPWTPQMQSFRQLWFSSPKLMRPEDYVPE